MTEVAQRFCTTEPMKRDCTSASTVSVQGGAEQLTEVTFSYSYHRRGWDYDRQHIRTFARRRMTSADDTGRLFKPAARFNLRKELQHSFGITRVKRPNPQGSARSENSEAKARSAMTLKGSKKIAPGRASLRATTRG